jgi:site-specific recombinase XerC
MRTPISLAALLERFFTERLMQQRQASPHTISSYRDSFHQFLKFTEQRLRKAPSRLSFQEIDASLIMAFLDHLEKHQGLSTRSRNLRLTALRSFFRFAAFEAPTHSAQIQRVLAIPSKLLPGPWSNFSHVPKSMPCWPLRISAHGLADGITPSFCWRYRRVCDYPR